MERVAAVQHGQRAAIVPAGPTSLSAETETYAPRRARTGSGGTTIFSGKIRYEEFNKSLENEYGLGQYSRQGVYDKMRRTSSQIQRALWLAKLPILAADAEVEGGAEEEHADLVAYNFLELIPWQARLREALTMLEFGVSCFEALADVQDVPLSRFPGLRRGKSGRPGADEMVPALLYTDFEARPAKTIYAWKARKEKPSQVAELVQWAGPTDGQPTPTNPSIPGDWLLRFTWEQEAGNFQGVSILRPLYMPWLMHDELEVIDGIRHERQNCGIPVITLPESATDEAVDKAQSILSSLASHEKAFLVLENGWTFKWDVSGSGSGTDIAGRLDQLKRDIADGVLAGFMALGNGDTGSYALAETQADRHLDLITVVANTALHTFNEGADGWSPVRRLIDWNYGRQSEYPRICLKNLRSKDDWAQTLPLLQQFLSVKALGPKTTFAMAAEIVRRLNLPVSVLPPEDEWEAETPEPAPMVGVQPEPTPPAPEETEAAA